jgi:CubicO group peptidase (beta-lactamase class C family)
VLDAPDPSPQGAPARAVVGHATPASRPPGLTFDFVAVSSLMQDAITARKLPGAVVLIGHKGDVLYHRAFGSRRFEGKSGSSDSFPPSGPMTEDTVFDVASLTKCLATATSIMQLWEHGKVHIDDPVHKYLPGFNAGNDPLRAQVTIRMLLTHTSGEPGDLDLTDSWGLAGGQATQGIHRGLTTPLQSRPGEEFCYSDVNFILLGALIETVTGQLLDDYVRRNIFAPLGMSDTSYLPAAKAWGPHELHGAAVCAVPTPQESSPPVCPPGTWSVRLVPRIAPTAPDHEGNPVVNPNYGNLLRGTVHDPTARRMGGVAGHAGLFSTARDIGIFAQALLDRLADRPSQFPLQQTTITLMTTPGQPGHTPWQLQAANEAARTPTATAATGTNQPPATACPAIAGQNLRGFGWDIDTAYSVARGRIFPIGSFGHTGFTGTSLWVDPGSETYLVILSNAIHPRGESPITALRGEIATATAEALRLDGGTSLAEP